MSVTVNSPIRFIMQSIRRDLTERYRILHLNGMNEYIHQLKELKTDNVSNSHVFDIGHAFDSEHTDYITESVCLAQWQDQLKQATLFLPHRLTVFVTRYEEHQGTIRLYVCEQQNANIEIYSFGYSNLDKQWVWLSFCRIPIEDGEISLVACPDVPVESRKKLYVDEPLMCNALLNLKGDAIELEPAQWFYTTEPAKAKAFQTPHPSVSIVRINTARIFRQPSGAGPTGVKQRGSDVRSHLRRVGNRVIIIKEFKRNGGAPQPAMKVVKMAPS